MSKKSRAQRARERPCRVFWGSHGCHKQAGHSGVHFCTRGCPIVPGNAFVNENGFCEYDIAADRWKTVEPSPTAEPNLGIPRD